MRSCSLDYVHTGVSARTFNEQTASGSVLMQSCVAGYCSYKSNGIAQRTKIRLSSALIQTANSSMPSRRRTSGQTGRMTRSSLMVLVQLAMTRVCLACHQRFTDMSTHLGKKGGTCPAGVCSGQMLTLCRNVLGF